MGKLKKLKKIDKYSSVSGQTKRHRKERLRGNDKEMKKRSGVITRISKQKKTEMDRKMQTDRKTDRET